MPSPFPGMNPYLEQEDVWVDFHQSFIPLVRDVLSAQVRPGYLVRVEEYLVIHELPEDEHRYLGRADVSVTRSPSSQGVRSGGGALEAPVYGRVPPAADIEHHSYLEIRDRRDRSLITFIEVLSPSNKRLGPDREQYLAKRRQLFASGVHLVEIDLLRVGPRLPLVELPDCDYCILVSRVEERPRVGIWPLRLRERLPLIPVPLRARTSTPGSICKQSCTASTTRPATRITFTPARRSRRFILTTPPGRGNSSPRIRKADRMHEAMNTHNALPAILGGEPVCPQGPPEWPIADEAVLAALRDAYSDGSWGRYHGGHVARLEQCLASEHGVDHALTCGSGTFAVEVALRALKVGPGDDVVMAAYDYGGNFLSVHAVGARPVLIDVDADNWNLAPEGLADALGPATRAAIVSHLHGGLVPMREVMELAKRYGVLVIEDAAQAPGALVQGRRVGSWGDVGVLSFGGSKLLTAGRGGAILTRHADVAQRARLWLQRGNHVCPLSELQAAVLFPQLDRLAERNAHRLRSVQYVRERFCAVPGLRLFRNRASGELRTGLLQAGISVRCRAIRS